MINNLMLYSKCALGRCLEILRSKISHLNSNKQKGDQWVVRLVWIIALTLLGCEESIKHDESLAGKRAKEFADAAFIMLEFENAYTKLSDATKRHVALADFKKTVVRIHKKGYPSKIELIEFEPVASEQKAIYIFLVGEDSSLRYYYT